MEQVARGLLETWLSTKNLAEKHGANFIGILQPNACLGCPKLDHLDLDVSYNKKSQQCLALYSVVLKLLEETRYQELSDKILNLTGVFDRDEYIYIDSCHVSPNGNRIIAGAIYNHIINSVENQ